MMQDMIGVRRPGVRFYFCCLPFALMLLALSGVSATLVAIFVR
jgi:hypothetical protein